MILSIPIKNLIPLTIGDRRVNPSKRISDTTDLQASIATTGLLHPPVVVPVDEDLEANAENQTYYILSGERRITALRQQGQKFVDCSVMHNLDEAGMVDVLAAGNVQKPLSPLQQANLCMIMAEQGRNKLSIGRAMGLDTSGVELLFSLLEASENVQRLVDSGKMGLSTFRTLAYRSQEEQDEIVSEVTIKNSDGRVTRNAVRSAKKRHDDAKKGTPMAGDVDSVQTLCNTANEAMGKLLEMAPYERSEKAAIRILLTKIQENIEELIDVTGGDK